MIVPHPPSTPDTSETLSQPAAGSAVDDALTFAKRWIANASFSRDAVASFSLNIFSAVVSLISTLILARVVGAANFGVYAVAIVYANVFAFVACLGFPQLIVRTQARATTSQTRVASRAVQETALAYAIVAGSVLAVIGVALSDRLLPASSPKSSWVFIVAMAMVIPIASQRLGEAILLGRHQPILSLLPERLFRSTAMLIAVLVIVWIAGNGLGATHAISMQAVAYTVSIASVFYLIARTGHAQPRTNHYSVALDPKLVKEALPYLVVGLTTLLAGRVDIMMLAALSDAETVGKYRLAAQIAAITLMISMVSQAVLSPKISKLSHDNELHTLLARLPLLSTTLVVIAGLLSLTVFVGFQFVVPWIGNEFADASPILAILLLGFTIIAFLSPALPLLTMSGRAKFAAVANVIAIAINILFNFILIPHFGGLGAAIATAMSLVTLYVLYACFAAPLAR